LGVQPQPLAIEDDALDFDEFPGALKTESCSVRRSLAHFGHAIFCAADITIRSYRV